MPSFNVNDTWRALWTNSILTLIKLLALSAGTRPDWFNVEIKIQLIKYRQKCIYHSPASIKPKA